MKKTQIFKVEGDKITRQRRHCPKCGPGVFIAEHKERYSCGKCGYTEFKTGEKKQNAKKIEEIKKEEIRTESPEKTEDTARTSSPDDKTENISNIKNKENM